MNGAMVDSCVLLDVLTEDPDWLVLTQRWPTCRWLRETRPASAATSQASS